MNIPIRLITSLALIGILASCCGSEKAPQPSGTGAGTPTSTPRPKEAGGPGVPETLRFIHNLSLVGEDPAEQLALSGPSSCVAVWSGQVTKGGEFSPSYTAHYEIKADFSQLNPDSLSLKPQVLRVRTTNAEKLIRTRWDKGDSESTSDALTFRVKAEEDQQKVREALDHAIQRCGGKTDLFSGRTGDPKAP
jgi:hypothetical protein